MSMSVHRLVLLYIFIFVYEKYINVLDIIHLLAFFCFIVLSYSYPHIPRVIRIIFLSLLVCLIFYILRKYNCLKDKILNSSIKTIVIVSDVWVVVFIFI